MFDFKEKGWFSGIAQALKKPVIDEGTWEELLDHLIMADVGLSTSERLIQEVKSNKPGSAEEVRSALRKEIVDLLSIDKDKERDFPKVVLMVGVNGSGKTTTCAKLAYKFKKEGKKVMLACADTFRFAPFQHILLLTGMQRQGDLALLLANRLAAPVNNNRLQLRLLWQSHLVAPALAGSHFQAQQRVRGSFSGADRHVAAHHCQQSSGNAFGAGDFQGHFITRPWQVLRQPVTLLLMMGWSNAPALHMPDGTDVHLPALDPSTGLRRFQRDLIALSQA